MFDRCIPPVRWLQRWFSPPKGIEDWQRIAFQPMLYLALWVGAIVVMVCGDRWSAPPTLRDTTEGVFVIWGASSLVCPPLALVALWMIQSQSGVVKYRGFWLRLGADIGQFTALFVYVAYRMHIGDYHVMTMAVLMSCVVFIGHLVMRDAKRVHALENLAKKLHRGEDI